MEALLAASQIAVTRSRSASSTARNRPIAVSMAMKPQRGREPSEGSSPRTARVTQERVDARIEHTRVAIEALVTPKRTAAQMTMTRPVMSNNGRPSPKARLQPPRSTARY